MESKPLLNNSSVPDANKVVTNNTGRQYVAREECIRHILSGIDEILPITSSLQKFTTRPRQKRLYLFQSRMVDDVKGMFDVFRHNTKAIDLSLPVMFIAFEEDDLTIPPDDEHSATDINTHTCSPCFVHALNKSCRFQLVFVAHEHETATAMADQMRVYMQKLKNQCFPIPWHHNGENFETTGMFKNPFEPVQSMVQLGGAYADLTALVWDLNFNYVLPFLGDAVGKTTKIGANEALDMIGTHQKWMAIEKKILKEGREKCREAFSINFQNPEYGEALLSLEAANKKLMSLCHKHYFLSHQVGPIVCLACGGRVEDYHDMLSYAVGYQDAGGNADEDINVTIDSTGNQDLGELEYYMKYKDNEFYQAGYNAFKQKSGS